MAEEKDAEKKSDFISGEDLLKGVTGKEARELGFLLLGVVFGAALGILGNLWVAFFVELVRHFISPELWIVASFLGLVITTMLSVYVLIKTTHMAAKYIIGKESNEQRRSSH